MYLKRKIYIGSEHDHNQITGEIRIAKAGVPLVINFNKLTYITESFGYWRKANHIHRWFVENVQSGEDDCHEYFVTKEQLLKLLETCHRVKNNPQLAEELLPTASGFFFGDTNYTQSYIDDIDDTIALLEDAVTYDDNSEFYYKASW